MSSRPQPAAPVEGLVPRMLDAGDCALVVELGSGIDAGINAAVIALDAAVNAAAIAGVSETVPTYRSLLIHFDPAVIRRPALAKAVAALWPPPAVGARGRSWIVPVAYGGVHGEDLAHVAALHQMTEAQVVALHTAPSYRVYMIGFAPGFAYLGGLAPELVTSRRAEPRPWTPSGTVSIGGVQAAISPPMRLPSGWQLLGQTPVRSWDPARAQHPFLFAAGDRVRFERIDGATFDLLAGRAAAGEIIARPDDGDA